MGRHAMIETPRQASVADAEPGTVLSRRSAGGLVAVFAGITIAALMGLVHLPYAILSPGPITNTLGNGPDGKPLITVDGKPTYPTTGTLDFTTVAVLGGPNRPVNAWDWVRGQLDRARMVVPAEDLFPEGVTRKQVESENAAEMADSQQEAIAIALRSLGQRVPEVVTIRDLTKGSPAKGVLQAGDVLVSIDGTPVTTPDGVRTAVRAHKPGESVALTVRRSGKEQVLTVRTLADPKGNTVVGVFLRNAFAFPIKVSIKAGNVGGPSAGMMFSLAIYDKLTPGALTGGAKIAGTGTIDSAGTVGPIGGIQQKLAGAQRGGATWFLAPAENCNEVVGNIPDGLQVLKVATFTQAREAVTAIAAKKTSLLPRCT